MALRIKSARWLFIDRDGSDRGPAADSGWELLEIEFTDGRVARIDAEQKLMAAGIDAVYLVGEHDFTDVAATFPHPDSGKSMTMRCVTTDAGIVAATAAFLTAVVNQTFTPRTL